MPLIRKITTTLAVGLLCLTASMATVAEMTVEKDTYVTFYHHDALGSAVMTSDEKGFVLWYENSDPYGKSQGRKTPAGNGFNDNYIEEATSRIGCAGHTQDNASGLVYMKARHYDPVIGRFYSNDPVGFTTNNMVMFNRYAYANNNPYRYIDPEGLVGEETVIKIDDEDSEDEKGVDNDNSEFLEDSLFHPDGIPGKNGLITLGPGPIPQLRGTLKGTSVPAPLGADSKLSRNGAFKEAKLKGGVPQNKNPDDVDSTEKLRDQEVHTVSRVYTFNLLNGDTVTIREHTLGHEVGNHGPLFNTILTSPEGLKKPLGGDGNSHTYINPGSL